MTDGHEHRVVHIASFDVWWVRAIRKPVLVFRPSETPYPDLAMARIDRSPYPYGHRAAPDGTDEYYLSTFGIIHRWTGLVLCNWARPCPTHDPLEPQS